MGVILDSSVLIAAERKRFDLVGFLSAHPDEAIFITAITASELLHGCERANDSPIRERRVRFVEGLLQDYAVLPFTLNEARTHAQLWADLERKGTPSPHPMGESDATLAHRMGEGLGVRALGEVLCPPLNSQPTTLNRFITAD